MPDSGHSNLGQRAKTKNKSEAKLLWPESGLDYNSESFRLSLEDYLESEDSDQEEAKDESKDEVEEQVARCVSTN